MKIMAIYPVALAIGILVAAPAQAQFTKNWKSWYGHVQGGFSLTQGDVSELADDGWTLGGGATYYPSDWPVGISMGLEYSAFDMSRQAKNFFESDGDVDIWAFTSGITWSPRLEGGVGFYLNGGVGVYRTEARLTEPAAWCGTICPPYSWWCVPGCVPGSIVTDSQSTTDFGYNLAAAMTFALGGESTLYVQAQYNSVQSDATLEFVPLVVGFRW
jgi:opacity protein-like surface antigen